MEILGSGASVEVMLSGGDELPLSLSSSDALDVLRERLR